MRPNENWENLKIVNSNRELNVGEHRVMKEWETPLMANRLVEFTKKGRIIEVGFGMGISASFIQENGVNSHTIIEPHPEIFEKAELWKEERVDRSINLVNGYWQESLELFVDCDGFFFDTYAPTIDYLITENVNFINTVSEYMKKGASIALFWILPTLDEEQQVALFKKFSKVYIEPVYLNPGETSVSDITEQGFLLSIIATK
jgi:guanidinoacetate N-methyltransferase